MKTKKSFGKRVVSGMIVVLMILSMVNVPAGSVQAASKSKITLNKTVITVKKGTKLKLKAKITDSKLKKKKIVWKSSKKSVATVDSKGVVKGNKNGKTQITATIKGTKNKAVCTVYVGTPVKALSLKEKSKTMEIGDTYSIKTVVNPQKATIDDLVYASSNKKIVEVSKKGIVTAKAKGQAKVTVTAKDEACTRKVVLTVTVVEKEPDTGDSSLDDAQTTTENDKKPEEGGQETTTEENGSGTKPEEGSDTNEEDRIELDRVIDEENPTNIAIYMSSSSAGKYTVYSVSGFQEELGKISDPQIVLLDSENTEVVSIEKYSESIEDANAPKTWAYRVKVKYKDSTAIQTIYIQYQQRNVDYFIDKIYYSSASGSETFSGLNAYKDENGTECIKIYDKEQGFDSWDKMYASAKFWNNIFPKYGFKIDANTHELIMGIKGTMAAEEGRFDEIGRYPLEVGYFPTITEVTDDHNYIWRLNALYGKGTVGNLAYAVLGEEDNLGENVQFVTEDENVTKIEYKPYAEINKADRIFSYNLYYYLAGELHVTYTDNGKEDTVIYGIYYLCKIHDLTLMDIKQPNNIISKIDTRRNTWQEYNVMGTAEELVYEGECKDIYQFDVKEKVNSVSVTKEELVTPKYKKYTLTIDYAGKEQKMTIFYFQMTEDEFLPETRGVQSRYRYTGKDGYECTGYISAARYIIDNGQKKISMIIDKDIDSNGITKFIFDDKYWNKGGGLNTERETINGFLSYSVISDEAGNRLLSVSVADKEVASYPLLVSYVPKITLVAPEDNMIADSGVISDNGMEKYLICAENETPNTEWNFQVPEGYKISYTAADDIQNGEIGTITITEDGNEGRILASYPVLYERKNHALEPVYIEVKDSIITRIAAAYLQDYYIVYGYGNELGEITELECDSAIGADYEVTEVEDEDWNYEIEVEYKGEKQKIKIKYWREYYNLLPELTYYYEDEEGTKIDLDSWLIEEGYLDDKVISYKLAIDAKDFQYWDKLQFSNPSIAAEMKCKYSMEKQSSGEYALKMSQGNSSVIIPTIIEYVPRILSITEEDNTLTTNRHSYKENSNELWKFYYIINGKKDTLGQNEVVIETTDPDATAYYRTYDEEEYKTIYSKTCTGEIVLSYTDNNGNEVTKYYPVVYN